MSGCSCSNPTDFRATGENTGEDHLYLRCSDCGGKAGRVKIDIDDFMSTVTNPEDLPTGRQDVAEKIVEHGMPTVSIHSMRATRLGISSKIKQSSVIGPQFSNSG